jgi:hypothetical protein
LVANAPYPVIPNIPAERVQPVWLGLGEMMTSKLVAGLLAGLTMLLSTAPSGAAEQSQQALTHDIVVVVAQQVLRCWNPPISPQGGKGIVVRLNISLSIDGRLTAMPTPAEQLDVKDSDVKAALIAATKAVYACAPYKLPPAQYYMWKDIAITFDPRSL